MTEHSDIDQVSGTATRRSQWRRWPGAGQWHCLLIRRLASADARVAGSPVTWTIANFRRQTEA